MKRNLLYILLAVLALSCFTLLYLWLTNTPPAIPVKTEATFYSVKTERLACFDSLFPITVDAVIESPEVNTVAFAVAGKLEQGTLRLEQGSSFSKGQLLFQINNKEAFATLNKVKTELASQVVRLLPRIETEFPAEKNKWVRFLEELKPQFLVPALPAFKTSGERYLFMESGCADTYSRLQELEVNMTNYFYVAPYDGTIVELYAEDGTQLEKGKPVARIARKMPFQIKARVSADVDGAFRNQTVQVKSIQGDLIGTATFQGKASSVNTDGTIHYRFSYQPDRQRPLFHGLKVQLISTKGKRIQLTEIPSTAIRNGFAQILSHKSLIEKPVTVFYNSAGKVAVTGIPCGAVCVQEYVSNPQHQGRYVPAQ